MHHNIKKYGRVKILLISSPVVSFKLQLNLLMYCLPEPTEEEEW
jgi:hypothetical protein